MNSSLFHRSLTGRRGVRRLGAGLGPGPGARLGPQRQRPARARSLHPGRRPSGDPQPGQRPDLDAPEFARPSWLGQAEAPPFPALTGALGAGARPGVPAHRRQRPDPGPARMGGMPSMCRSTGWRRGATISTVSCRATPSAPPAAAAPPRARGGGTTAAPASPPASAGSTATTPPGAVPRGAGQPDLVLFLGDYIYRVAQPANAERLARPQPLRTAHTLQDYRDR